MRRLTLLPALLALTIAQATPSSADTAAAPDEARFVYIVGENNSGDLDFSPYLLHEDWDAPLALDPAGELDVLDPVWSQDGTMIAFAAWERACMGHCYSHIYVMDADGTNRRAVTEGNVYDGMPAWSPTGVEIAFVRSPYGADSQLRLVHISGGESIRLAPEPGSYLDPTWSPDASTVAYAFSSDVTDHNIWTVSVADGVRTKLGTMGATALAWSPDGKRIAFSSDTFRSSLPDQVFVMDADGSHLQQLTNVTIGNAGYPSWSPDGSQLAYAAGPGGDVHLMVMDADGSDAFVLVDTPGVNMQPAWRPFQPLAPTERPGGSFFDDNGNVHEGNIEAIAAAEITRGCNPPVNDAFCPDQPVTRGQMAAFLRRGLGLNHAGSSDLFIDDDDSIFEADIEQLAIAGITRGCNPPVNDSYCPSSHVTRAQMGSFLARALNLDPIAVPPGLELWAGGIGDIELGDTVDEVLPTLLAALGPTSFDDLMQPPEDPLPYGYVAYEYFRAVSWARPEMSLIFSDADYYRTDGEPHLIAISVRGSSGGAIIPTNAGIRVGHTYDEVEAAYGSSLRLLPFEACMLGWEFVVEKGDKPYLRGVLTGDPSEGTQTVKQIWTGARATC